MLRTIKLHGIFATYHDGPVQIDADTAAEIIESLTRQVKGFRPHPVNGRQKIIVAGFDSEESLYQDLGDTTELHVMPQLGGSKSQAGMTQILLGAVLVGVGIALGTTGVGGFFGGIAIKVGAMMILGGLSQLLSPQPEDDKDEAIKNRYLGTPKNTVQIGTRIPILYGEDRVYGHYISFDINAIEFRGTANESTSGGK